VKFASVLSVFLWSAVLPGISSINPSPEAEDGHAQKQFELGRAYLAGEGLEKNPAKALELMKKAADQNHPDALGGVGYFYSSGLVVEKDEAKARGFFERGAKLGSSASQSNLGIYLIRGLGGEKDVPGGLSLMHKAVKAGSQQAAILLGEIYYTGEHANGTPDFSKAYEVLIGPAGSGNAIAQNTVGVMLKDGRLGSKDIDAARVWFEKAAMQGNAKACTNLFEIWDYQSENRLARIEAIRWLLVANQLEEVMAMCLYKDIKSFFANPEERAASQLAEMTLRAIKTNR